MIRISIKWVQPDLVGMTLTGAVTVYDTQKNEFLGEWLIEVNDTSLHHKARPDERSLPEVHDMVHHRVDQLAKAYWAGFSGQMEVHSWMEEPPQDEKCVYCGNSLNSKYHHHTTCGMD